VKPGSAWCRPDEGVHVILDALPLPVQVVQHWVGETWESRGHVDCCPCRFVDVLAIEPATEAAGYDGWDEERFPHLALLTLRALP
jgi:hypothetical protein